MKSAVKRRPRYWRVQSQDSSTCDLSVDETVTCDGQPSCCFRNDERGDLGLSGDSDWQRWAVVLDVPPSAYSVVVSVTLKGNGEVFFSNLSFETVGQDVPTTDRRTGPKNLTFAETL